MVGDPSERLGRGSRAVVKTLFSVDPALYLLSRKGAPRGQIFALPLAQLDLAQAKVVVPQTSGSSSEENNRASIEEFVPAPGHLYVIDIMGGPSRVRVFDSQGKALPAPALPPVPAVGEVLSIGRGDILFFTSTYLEPSVWGTALTPPAEQPPAPRYSRLLP